MSDNAVRLLTERIAAVEEQRDEARAEVERYREQVVGSIGSATLLASVECLRAENERLRDENERLTAEAAGWRFDFDNARAEIGGLREAVAEARAEVERLKQENRELKTRIYLVHRSILAPMALVERMDAATAGVPTARPAALDGES